MSREDVPVEPVVGRTMPAPPTKCSWILELDSEKDQGILWAKRDTRWTWLTGKPGWKTEELEFLRQDDTYLTYLQVSTETVDKIVERTIVAAEKIVKDLAEVPARRKLNEDKLNEISRRLGGITVRVK